VTTRPCAVCLHERRAEIELAHVNGVSAPALGKRHKLHPQALRRHMVRHVTEDQRQVLKYQGYVDEAVDLEAMRNAETRSLLANLIAERVRQSRLAARAELGKDVNTAVRASAEVVRTIARIAGLLGELPTGHVTNNITNNLLVSPQWATIRQLIVVALRPYTDAQRAVIEALERHEAHELASLPAPPAESVLEAEYAVVSD